MYEIEPTLTVRIARAMGLPARSILFVSDVAREYASGSRESAAAAAQLNVLAAELRSSISQFRTEG